MNGHHYRITTKRKQRYNEEIHNIYNVEKQVFGITNNRCLAEHHFNTQQDVNNNNINTTTTSTINNTANVLNVKMGYYYKNPEK